MRCVALRASRSRSMPPKCSQNRPWRYMPRMWSKPAAFAAALLLYSPSASAWGGLGHEAICELAFLELDDTARQRVMELIRQDQEATGSRQLRKAALV